MFRHTNHCKMSLAFLSPTRALPRVNYCSGNYLLVPAPKVPHLHERGEIMKPGLRSVFAGFDSDFFAVPSPLLDFPPALTNFKGDIMRLYFSCYKVTENDKQFRLAVDVPGMKPENLKIELEDDGTFLASAKSRPIRPARSINSISDSPSGRTWTRPRSLHTYPMVCLW